MWPSLTNAHLNMNFSERKKKRYSLLTTTRLLLHNCGLLVGQMNTHMHSICLAVIIDDPVGAQDRGRECDQHPQNGQLHQVLS
jgi:hypothetical protein